MKKLIIITVTCVLIIVGGIIATIIGIMNATQVEVEIFTEETTPVTEQDIHVATYMPPTYEMYLWQSYPVLYIHGGHELMANWQEDDTQGWTIQQTLDDLILEDEMEEVVVVTIYDEQNDLLPTLEGLSGDEVETAVEDYPQFFQEQIQPYTDRLYRLDEQEVQHLYFHELEGEGNIQQRLQEQLLDLYGI